jgi:DNA repair exonuclease SbcCD ATPase subunit
MDEKLKKDVEAVVAAIFSEQEEAEIRKQTEEALNKSANTIEELTTALEAKNSEFEELEAKLSESEDKAKNLKTELEAAQEKIEQANKKLEDSEGELDKIKKDRATEIRMKELEEAGVASDKEAQSTKVREMSDEDFASYKVELVSVREAVIAELSKFAAKDRQEQEDAEKAAAEAAAAEGKIQTPPANIDPGTAIAAALNLEIFPPKDMVAKYSEMGKAMAKLFNTEKNDD